MGGSSICCYISFLKLATKSSLGVEMSIVICGFLGHETQDLEKRVVQEFSELGFKVEIHPDINLLQQNDDESLYLNFLETPAYIKRSYPGVPLLAGCGYYVSLNPGGANPDDKNRLVSVDNYTYQVCTRTSSGRSPSSFYAQALTVAILSKITGGQFYAEGHGDIVSGDSGLEQILTELRQDADLEFDADAYPFQTWPPIDPTVAYTWPAPLESKIPKTVAKSIPPKKIIKITPMGLFCLFIFLYFSIVTIIYS